MLHPTQYATILVLSSLFPPLTSTTLRVRQPTPETRKTDTCIFTCTDCAYDEAADADDADCEG